MPSSWGWGGEERIGNGDTRDQVGWVGDRMEWGSIERDVLMGGYISGLGRNPVPGKLSGINKGRPHLRLLVIVERVPELAIPHN